MLLCEGIAGRRAPRPDRHPARSLRPGANLPVRHGPSSGRPGWPKLEELAEHFNAPLSASKGIHPARWRPRAAALAHLPAAPSAAGPSAPWSACTAASRFPTPPAAASTGCPTCSSSRPPPQPRRRAQRRALAEGQERRIGAWPQAGSAAAPSRSRARNSGGSQRHRQTDAPDAAGRWAGARSAACWSEYSRRSVPGERPDPPPPPRDAHADDAHRLPGAAKG